MEQGARVEFDNSDLVRSLCGGHNENLKLIERRLGVHVGQRGSQLLVGGEPSAVAFTEKLLQELYGLLKAGYPLYAEDIDQAIKILSNNPGTGLKEIFLDTVFVSNRRRMVAPKGLSQKRYVESIRTNDIVFGIGPAGTGKTYLAVASAVAALSDRKVKRIVLTRPAVEAGEKLGFLPGDIAEKVNPYLRPLLDALSDMMDNDKVTDLLARGTIEIAPLAFMRGRTLNDSFVILDEAQNTTPEQMKMFLTRIGFGSKAVITGDVTQVDLPTGKASGLVEAQRILKGIEGIDLCTFSQVDVVRHPLVQEVIRAYEVDEARKAAAKEQARARFQSQSQSSDAEAANEEDPAKAS